MIKDESQQALDHCRRMNGRLHGCIERQRIYQMALMGLTMSKSFSQGALDTVVMELTQVLVESLRLTAAAVWLYEAEEELFRCSDRYELIRQEHHAVDVPLHTGAHSAFGNQLRKGRLITSHSADSEVFADILQVLLGASAKNCILLIAPIHLADHLYGFVCCESTLPRHWQREEKFFTAQVARLVPLAIESEARRRAEASSRDQAAELSRKVEELSLLNRRLEQATEQMFRTEKMATIGLLAEGIVHEINNSLSFMKSNLFTLGGYMETLIQHALPSAAQTTNGDPDLAFIGDDCGTVLEEVHQGLRRITQTIGDLRVFAHPGESGMQRIDIHGALDAVLRLVQNRYWNTIEVVKEYGDIPDIECISAVQLNEVFLKLVVHAYVRLKGRGRLTLHTARSDDGGIMIDIADNGPALSDEEQMRLFEPFGTGGTDDQMGHIRLYTARRILTQRGGRLDVKSAMDGNTSFCVVLPAHNPTVPGR